MIEKDGEHEFTLICDECGTETDEVFDSFTDVVDFKKNKENGWHSVNEDDEWEDLCPDCWNRIHNVNK
jgi:hypothetical protein